MEQEEDFGIDYHSDLNNETIGKKSSKGKVSIDSPIAAISILTLIGIVCVVIDLFLEKE